MTDPKLEIIPKKYSGESTVISLRITKAMLADIDKIAAETGRTRNELMLCVSCGASSAESAVHGAGKVGARLGADGAVSRAALCGADRLCRCGQCAR